MSGSNTRINEGPILADDLEHEGDTQPLGSSLDCEEISNPRAGAVYSLLPLLKQFA
jgi:hypothetical protein